MEDSKLKKRLKKLHFKLLEKKFHQIITLMMIKSYERYLENIKNTYMYKYKFPPKMFQNIELIDFGAGRS